ncbi:MAG TPA: YdeI/OmpD-associated family protein [Gemmataceae bacterium]|nr:YdeI/OmpD-associated family protein [Gemmataceae bacterium]
MGKKADAVDAYIAKSGDFAKPILKRLREIVHAACPSAEEEMKWSHPHFSYKGMLCSMHAFKAHCSFGFWLSNNVGTAVGPEGTSALKQCHRLTSVDDLPSKNTLTDCIKAAMKLNDDGVKVSRPKKKPKPAPAVPDDLKKALKTNAKAQATFEGFSPSAKREYIDWITDAKTDETRQRRLATAIEWMSEGKQRNWKYQKC